MTIPNCKICHKRIVTGHLFSPVDGKIVKPEVGAYVPCSHCGNISIFTSEYDATPATREQLMKFLIEEPAAYFAVIEIQKFIRSSYWQGMKQYF